MGEGIALRSEEPKGQVVGAIPKLSPWRGKGGEVLLVLWLLGEWTPASMHSSETDFHPLAAGNASAPQGNTHRDGEEVQKYDIICYILTSSCVVSGTKVWGFGASVFSSVKWK